METQKLRLALCKSEIPIDLIMPLTPCGLPFVGGECEFCGKRRAELGNVCWM